MHPNLHPNAAAHTLALRTAEAQRFMVPGLTTLKLAIDTFEDNPDLLTTFFHHFDENLMFGPMLALLHLLRLRFANLEELPFSMRTRSVWDNVFSVISPMTYERFDVHLHALLADFDTATTPSLQSLIDCPLRDGIAADDPQPVSNGDHADFSTSVAGPATVENRLGLTALQYLAWFHPGKIADLSLPSTSSSGYGSMQEIFGNPAVNDPSGLATLCQMSPGFCFSHLWISQLALNSEKFPEASLLVEQHPALPRDLTTTQLQLLDFLSHGQETLVSHRLCTLDEVLPVLYHVAQVVFFNRIHTPFLTGPSGTTATIGAAALKHGDPIDTLLHHVCALFDHCSKYDDLELASQTIGDVLYAWTYPMGPALDTTMHAILAPIIERLPQTVSDTQTAVEKSLATTLASYKPYATLTLPANLLANSLLVALGQNHDHGHGHNQFSNQARALACVFNATDDQFLPLTNQLSAYVALLSNPYLSLQLRQRIASEVLYPLARRQAIGPVLMQSLLSTRNPPINPQSLTTGPETGLPMGLSERVKLEELHPENFQHLGDFVLHLTDHCAKREARPSLEGLNYLLPLIAARVPMRSGVLLFGKLYPDLPASDLKVQYRQALVSNPTPTTDRLFELFVTLQTIPGRVPYDFSHLLTQLSFILYSCKRNDDLKHFDVMMGHVLKTNLGAECTMTSVSAAFLLLHHFLQKYSSQRLPSFWKHWLELKVYEPITSDELTRISTALYQPKLLLGLLHSLEHHRVHIHVESWPAAAYPQEVLLKFLPLHQRHILASAGHGQLSRRDYMLSLEAAVLDIERPEMQECMQLRLVQFDESDSRKTTAGDIEMKFWQLLTQTTSQQEMQAFLSLDERRVAPRDGIINAWLKTVLIVQGQAFVNTGVLELDLCRNFYHVVTQSLSRPFTSFLLQKVDWLLPLLRGCLPLAELGRLAMADRDEAYLTCDEYYLFLDNAIAEPQSTEKVKELFRQPLLLFIPTSAPLMQLSTIEHLFYTTVFDCPDSIMPFSAPVLPIPLTASKHASSHATPHTSRHASPYASRNATEAAPPHSITVYKLAAWLRTILLYHDELPAHSTDLAADSARNLERIIETGCSQRFVLRLLHDCPALIYEILAHDPKKPTNETGMSILSEFSSAFLKSMKAPCLLSSHSNVSKNFLDKIITAPSLLIDKDFIAHQKSLNLLTRLRLYIKLGLQDISSSRAWQRLYLTLKAYIVALTNTVYTSLWPTTPQVNKPDQPLPTTPLPAPTTPQSELKLRSRRPSLSMTSPRARSDSRR